MTTSTQRHHIRRFVPSASKVVIGVAGNSRIQVDKRPWIQFDQQVIPVPSFDPETTVVTNGTLAPHLGLKTISTILTGANAAIEIDKYTYYDIQFRTKL